MVKERVLIGYQGEPGAYSEEAILTHYDPYAETVPYESFHSLLKAVEKDEVVYGLLPVENSLTDTIWEAYELLIESTVKPCREIIHRIRHYLMCSPEVDKITKVYSHPEALKQCNKFLSSQGYVTLPEIDTAASARKLKEGKLEKDAGVIASERAAKIYGLKILTRGIADNPENYTRFFLVGKKDAPFIGNDKTSLVFELPHVAGSLHRVTSVFAERKINMTKLQSRRIVGKPWEYRFILDCEGHREDDVLKSALEELEKITSNLKVLGSYPKAIL
ncbi:MAG: prephenate dehydratase [Candidatus Aenigmarchaeota archaeon]|nr:prephenate dehydratase [Candidatus Aenigmarchaeota archaeon]